MGILDVTPMEVSKVIFWDIDGTLVDAAGAGISAWLEGMRACFDLEGNIEGIRWAGRTDPFIGKLFFEKFGIEMTDAAFSRFLEHYVSRLPESLEQRKGQVLPGIPRMLEHIHRRSDLAQGLLTGNIARGAEHKLRHFGLWYYFPFGSFADGIFDRNELSPVALRIAREQIRPGLGGEDLIIIGDTPYDIACGKVIGAKTVAVATGHFSQEQLAESAPDWLFRDFREPDRVLEALGLD